MLSFTHLLFSGAASALLLNDPVLAGVSALAGLLPDVDTPRSLPGRLLFPISRVVGRWGHRQVTHSLMGSIIMAMVTLPVLVWAPLVWVAIQVGYFTGWILDAASKSGVPVLYPSPKRLVFPFDPNFRLKTGSPVERLFQAVLVILLSVLLSNVMDGGIQGAFRGVLATDTAAVDFYREYGSSSRIYGDVEGLLVVENRRVAGRFEIVGTDGDYLILLGQDGNRYGSNQQIKITRINTTKREGQKITVRPINIVESVPIADLAAVASHRKATFTGILTLDDEPPVLRPDPRYFQTVELTGESLKLSAATIADLAPLADTWVVGNVVMRE